METIFCPSCGTKIPHDSVFCLKCGRSMAVSPNKPSASMSAPGVARRISLTHIGLASFWLRYLRASHGKGCGD
jgi:hypothetical protein